MSETLQFLPSISEVDAADDAFGKLMSDLDRFTSAAETFSSGGVSVEDAVFMGESGIGPMEAPRHVDPAVIARLLVFADETIDDAAKIRRDAEKLRHELLWIYRTFLIDRHHRGRDVVSPPS